MAELIRSDQQKTKKWSGGTTRELYIYPQNSSYELRNFAFRISSAECADETSVFTELPGIERILLVLKGHIFLKHTVHADAELKEGRQDHFSGEEKTVCRGCCTDFNLMLARNYSGNVKYLTLDTGKTGYLDHIAWKTGIYVYDGTAEVRTQGDAFRLTDGDILMAERGIDGKSVQIGAITELKAVICRIVNV